jgi:hypothetical protein
MQAKAVFPIVTGIRLNNEVLSGVTVGFSYLYPDQDYYVLKFPMFPRDSYFMVKTFKRPFEYFLYSRKKRVGERTRFQGIVGVAHLDENLKTHMELELPMLQTKLFMSLQPKQGV